MARVVVIDYGMGNLRSVAKALEKVSRDTVLVTSDAKAIRAADRLVFPGVGAIRDCMQELHRLELTEVIREESVRKPFLGICLGMQALMDFSEENQHTDCLSIFKGSVKKFQFSPESNQANLKIPHMGWNQVRQQFAHPCWKDIEDDSRFYFVHSYYVESQDRALVAGVTEYGKPFDAALAQDFIFAVQFHPEKSQTAGLQLLENFCNWDGHWAR